MEYYSAIKKNKGCHIEWSKSDTERQVSYNIADMWTLKKGTNALIYKTEVES